MVQVLTQRD